MTNLNFGGWDRKEVRVTSLGLKYKLMDLDSKKYRWITREEIIKECSKDGIAHINSYKKFMEQTEKIESDFLEYNGDFEKVILKKFYTDETKTAIDAEIIETHFPSYPGKFVSMPKLVKRLIGADFNKKMEAWGIDAEVLIESKKMNVEEIDLSDDYNNIHFYTTLSKYNLEGEKMSWGKTYLPVKVFKVKRYSDKTPFYNAYIKEKD